MSPTERRNRIDALSDAERAQMDAWADRWIKAGLNTQSADRPRFEAAVAECYRFAGLTPPKRVVWVSSPLVMALAAPIAAHLLDGGAVGEAVTGAVGEAVTGAVRGAVNGAVNRAVHRAVGEAVGGAVDGAVIGAVNGAVNRAMRGVVDEAVHRAVDGAVGEAVRKSIASQWSRYLGGQFWVGGWWGGAWTSFFREVCHLDLPGDLWDRARAYEATMESASWWWPHREFVMVCERPTVIRRELANPDLPRSWNSHRLHCETGPAVAWPDGWGVYSWHGVRVEPWVIETPAADLTVTMIHEEPNAEVRRVLMARMGVARYLIESKAQPVQADDYGHLYEVTLGDGRAMRVVRVVNGTPEGTWVETGDYVLNEWDESFLPEPELTFIPSTEPREDCEQGRDGMWYKVYWLRVPSRIATARAAVAWTNWHDDPSTYEEVVRT